MIENPDYIECFSMYIDQNHEKEWDLQAGVRKDDLRGMLGQIRDALEDEENGWRCIVKEWALHFAMRENIRGQLKNNIKFPQERTIYVWWDYAKAHRFFLY